MNQQRQARQRHPASFHLEAVRAEGASDAERAWVEEHLRTCGRCQALSAALGGAHEEFAGAVLAKTTPALEARLARRRPWQMWLAGGLLLPAAAALSLVVGRGPGPASIDADPELAVKGGAGLLVVARRDDRVFPVRQSDPLRAGDSIRFVLERVTHPFVMVASVDGAGHATLYVPYEGRQSVPIAAAARVEMDGSIVLDQSPGPERVFALFSRRPLQAEPVRKALAALGARGAVAIRKAERLEVGADDQATALLEKAAR